MERLLEADVWFAKATNTQAGDMNMALTANAGGEFQNRARSNATDAVDKAAELAGKAGQQLDKVITTAETAVRGVTEHSREAGERVQEVAGNLKTAIDKSVTDQPMATLAVAAALGFVIGALWKS